MARGYGGQVDVRMDDDHIYWVNDREDARYFDDRPAPSVTQILGRVVAHPHRVTWAAGLAAGHMLKEYRETGHLHVGDLAIAKNRWREIRDAAGARGTEYHASFEDAAKRVVADGGSCEVLGDTPPTVGEQLLARCAGVLPVGAPDVRTMSEQMLYSRKLDMAGTPDLAVVNRKEGRGYMLDLKTTGRIDVQHVLQLVAYCMLVEDFYYEGVPLVWSEYILHVPAGKVHKARLIDITKKRWQGKLPTYSTDREAVEAAAVLGRRLSWQVPTTKNKRLV